MQTRFLLLCLMLGQAAYSQTFTGKITKTLAFEKKSSNNALVIANVNGSVTVTGYEGDQVLVEVDRSIRGKTDERLQKGKEEVQLGIKDLADTLILYIRDGCHRFERNSGKSGHRDRDGWGYYSDGGCDLVYDYKMDFTVKVPASVHVSVSTINQGDVAIDKVRGHIRASNINGSIRLGNLQQQAVAHTINGDVDVVYARNPDKDCSFYTLNGDINALFQPGLSANMSFDSFNGDLYTNIARLGSLPAKVVKEQREDGIKYKIGGNRYVIGSGGALLEFETFNGNVYIKEKK